jgi:hypothetical protein
MIFLAFPSKIEYTIYVRRLGKQLNGGVKMKKVRKYEVTVNNYFTGRKTTLVIADNKKAVRNQYKGIKGTVEEIRLVEVFSK